MPSSLRSYYEPFVGGGALFFAIQPSRATLSDNSPELINCYVQVRDHADEVIEHLAAMENTEEDYYKIRDNDPTTEVARAARLIYLVTLSFNGIYRLNLKGEFNVPYGHKTHLRPCDPVRIRAASTALSHADILCVDFEGASTCAGEGDLVYLDPPYTVAHGNNGFLKYNARIFSWSDQVRLSEFARSLARRGCRVIVSNADHPSIVSLYPDFRMQLIKRASVIAASSQFRRNINECVLYNEV